MGIKRYKASSDSTISNAYDATLTSRATGSNMGASDIVEVFSVYGQVSSSSGLSAELARGIVKFPIADMITDRATSALPASGNVNFFLRMYNAPHSQELPRNFDIVMHAVTTDWEEGEGLDMEGYTDSGSVNWITAKSASSGVTMWTTNGGDYDAHFKSSFTASFKNGDEDIEVDVSSLVEQWMNSSGNILGSKSNYGLILKLTDTAEAASQSYYTKKFFGRDSEFFYRRPIIEARWDSSLKDDRGRFYTSSSLATAADNLNTVYLYNWVRGRLSNIPDVGTGSIYLRTYTTLTGSELITTTPSDPVTGSHVSKGIYKAQFALNTTSSTVYDRWFSSGLSTCYHTGTISTIPTIARSAAPTFQYAAACTNLKSIYSNTETARLNFFIREKNWSPTIYSKAVASIDSTAISSGSYRIYRVADGLETISLGTGSTLHTRLSYDCSGSYADLDMSMFESGYSYIIQLSYYNEDLLDWVELSEEFKFRVEE